MSATARSTSLGLHSVADDRIDLVRDFLFELLRRHSRSRRDVDDEEVAALGQIVRERRRVGRDLPLAHEAAAQTARVAKAEHGAAHAGRDSTRRSRTPATETRETVAAT